MRLPGFIKKLFAPVGPPGTGGWMSTIRDTYPGQWQQHVATDTPESVLKFAGVFAPLTLIAGDVSKLRIKLTQYEGGSEIGGEVTNSPFIPVLRKPNAYQTRIQFVETWILSKLIHGNTYVLKRRDARRVVTDLYVLDPTKVLPLVADNGDVYYELKPDNMSRRLKETVKVPAMEIIHDRWNCFWHPLVGIAPLTACFISATQGGRIQSNSTKFFDNMSRPSGVLTAPGAISDETARRLKEEWNNNFSGNNLGKTAVLGDGLKYEAMAIPAQQSQLVEQWKLTVEDCAKVFHVPLFKVGGPIPIGSTIEALNLVYYSDCLQTLIEAFELCMDEGLSLPSDYYTELDLEGLLRMDNAAQLEALGMGVEKGIMAPDEARAKRNLRPVPGGKYPYLQQQNYSLAALEKRDAGDDPFGTAKEMPAPPPSEPEKSMRPWMIKAAASECLKSRLHIPR